MELKNIAINMYKQGKTLQEIRKKVGIDLDEEMIKKWIEEVDIHKQKDKIFKLDKKQRQERDYNSRKKLALELKEALEKNIRISTK